MIDALVARLKVLPESDPRSRAAILARVRGRRQSPLRSILMGAWHQSAASLATAAALVLAVGVGYALRVVVAPATEPQVAAIDSPSVPMVPVSNAPASELSSTRPVPTTFILKATGANRVALVGDFNGWDRTATALTDPSKSGVWEITVPLTPGRHTYAFLVDDSVWTVDPRMPQEKDPDFGSTSSVILVTDNR